MTVSATPPKTERSSCYRAISRRNGVLAHAIILYQRCSLTFFYGAVSESKLVTNFSSVYLGRAPFEC